MLYLVLLIVAYLDMIIAYHKTWSRAWCCWSNDDTYLGIPLDTSEGTEDGTIVGDLDDILLGAELGTFHSNILRFNDCISLGPYHLDHHLV